MEVGGDEAGDRLGCWGVFVVEDEGGAKVGFDWD